jgi:hypothetical protein
VRGSLGPQRHPVRQAVAQADRVKQSASDSLGEDQPACGGEPDFELKSFGEALDVFMTMPLHA